MTCAIAPFVTFIVLLYKGFAFNHLGERPTIGFAGRKMRSKMKAENGTTETFRCNAGMRDKNISVRAGSFDRRDAR